MYRLPSVYRSIGAGIRESLPHYRVARRTRPASLSLGFTFRSGQEGRVSYGLLCPARLPWRVALRMARSAGA
eukprot:365128-Prymnesium_polylepis.1